MIASAAAGNNLQQQEAASAIIEVQVRSSGAHQQALLEAVELEDNCCIGCMPISGLPWWIDTVLKHATYADALKFLQNLSTISSASGWAIGGRCTKNYFRFEPLPEHSLSRIQRSFAEYCSTAPTNEFTLLGIGNKQDILYFGH